MGPAGTPCSRTRTAVHPVLHPLDGRAADAARFSARARPVAPRLQSGLCFRPPASGPDPRHRDRPTGSRPDRTAKDDGRPGALAPNSVVYGKDVSVLLVLGVPHTITK